MPPASSSGPDVARWLNDHFMMSLRRNCDPHNWQRTNPETGLFAMPLICLAYCEATAGLVLGEYKPGEAKTVDFIRNWLGRAGAPSSARYQVRGAALFKMFRHGLVHGRVPSPLQVPSNRELTWA